jgi:hypothetical protein
MAVNLSPVGGVAAQFFDNNGLPLSGGFLYTYLAGTSTPAATYTTISGLIANSNPIVLNAAGRVADSGEIWLSNGVSYKFVLKNSNDVQIAVWDNITGINSTTLSYTLQEQTFTATQGQTVFTLTGGVNYTPATNSITVFVNGSKQIATVNYTETSTSSITFLAGLNVGDIVDVLVPVLVATNAVDSVNVSYKAPFTNSITTNVQTKLAQIVSVKDFGAVGNGSTNDQAAIQSAISYAQSISNGYLYFPAGNYYITSALVFTSAVGIDCASGALITASDNSFNVLTLAPANYANKVLNIPSIVNGFNGLYLYGTSLAQIFIGNIANSQNGLTFAVDNTNKVCADNVVTFTAINSCVSSGVIFLYNATTTSGTLMQGNQVKGNFISNCLYSIQFYDINNGSLANLPWDDTEIDVFALEGNNLTNSVGIFGNPSLPPARCTFKHRGFFGGFDTAYIKGTVNNALFELGFDDAPAYAKMQISGGGNRLINTAAGQNSLNTYIALTTTYNTLTSFNSGNPVNANRMLCQFTLSSSLTTGQSIAFYFYHPLMTNYRPKVTCEPFWDIGASPMIVTLCSESSTTGVQANPYPFQGTLQLYALGAVAAGTYKLAITVHDAPQ